MAYPIQESLDRINAQSNQDRIKLETLRACFINTSQAFHSILYIHDRKRHDCDSFMECSQAECKSNTEVLIKLGLL